MATNRRFFSGDSLAQALNQAAQHFGLMPSEIDYRLVEKRHGFLKVRRKVVIEVDESAPRKSEETPQTPAERVDQAAPGAGKQGAETEKTPEPASGGWAWKTDGSDVAAEAPASSSESVASERAPSWKAEAGEPAAEEEPEPKAAEEPAAPGAHLDEPVVEPVAEPDLDAERPDEQPAEPESSSYDPPFQEPSAPEPTAPDAPDALEGGGHFELAEAPAPATKRFPPAEGEEAEAAAKALQMILDLASLELESEILQGDEKLEIELWGRGQKILLRDRGRLLLAIQHLLPRAIRGFIGRSVACRVDSDNFHEIREERLRDLAQRAADDVHQRGRTKTLEPMSPDERRIVHLTLSDYPGVETESQGSGLFKRVMVRKVREGRQRGGDRYNR